MLFLSFVPPSAGVFFLVDFDSIMPKHGPGVNDSGLGALLSNEERLDNAVDAMLEQGVFIVRSILELPLFRLTDVLMVSTSLRFTPTRINARS